MFSKKKCPHCGAKNPKENMTCENCSAVFDSGQAGGRTGEEKATVISQSSTRIPWQGGKPSQKLLTAMNRPMIVNLIDKDVRKGLHILFAVAAGFVMWHNFWEWWQALLLVAGLIVIPYIIARWLPVVVFWMIAAPLLLIFTYISIFWVVSGPDTTVPVTIVSKWEDVWVDVQGRSSPVTTYWIRAVDDDGHSWKVEPRFPQWESLSEGDRTGITYHYERVAGRWFPRRVKTMLGQESVVAGGGRWGSFVEGLNTVMDMVVSAVPFSILAALWLKYLRQEMRRPIGKHANAENTTN